ncbi:MAG: fibronectin type III domain-containing protein [Nitrospirae bacterium]|nr:fibronectin type III domain-containing protein [Nitrospirota bacterium]
MPVNGPATAEVSMGFPKKGLSILASVLFLAVSLMGEPSGRAGQATLSWDPPAANQDGSALTDFSGYRIYYGATSGTRDTVLDAGNTLTYTVQGLQETVTYYFVVTAYTTSENESGYSNEVSKTVTDTVPPVITNIIVSGITSSSVTLTWNTDEPATSQAEYGTGTAYGSFTTKDPALVTSHQVVLSGLLPWTTYHFRVISQDQAGNTSISGDSSVTTIAPPDLTPPSITGIGTTNLSDTGATVVWGTDEPATTQIEYGLTTAYGQSSSLDNAQVTTHSVALSGLAPSTTYHYRVKSVDAAGNTAISGDYTFTTADPPDLIPPVISGIQVVQISDSSATVTWSTDEPASSQVEYGVSAAYGAKTTDDFALVSNHTVSLSGLSPNTVYHVRIISTDGSGNMAVSSDYIFLTTQVIPPDQPMAISDLRVLPDSATRSTVILEWTATGADGNQGTAVRYDLRMSQFRIVEDGSLLNPGEIHFSDALLIGTVPVPQPSGTPQSVQVSGLETNTAYFFAIKAIDEKNLASPLSNVINGNLLPPLPVTAVRKGYTMVAFPLIPATSDVQNLLGSAKLYWWSSSGLGVGQGSFVPETQVVPGYGYFLKSDTPNAVLNISGTEVTDPRAIPLQPGWNMIGNPYAADILLKDTQIRNIDTGEMKTLEGAVTAGWVGNALYEFNGSTYTYQPYLEARLKLWHGYWLAVLSEVGSYELIISKP